MKISVYITSYNQQDYLVEAIESVLAQTLRPSQIIIVDDASTDSSPAVIQGYAGKYPDLIHPIFHEKNLGVTLSRLDALSAVRGDYLTYVDGDDRMLDQKLEREAAKLLKNPDAKFVYSNHYYINENGNRTGRWIQQSPPPQGMIFDQTFSRSFPGKNLFRMELVEFRALQEVGFHDPDLRIYEDFDLRIRLTKKFAGLYVNQPLFEIRLHSGGLSGSHADDHLAALEYIYRKNQPLLADLPERKAKELSRKYYKFPGLIAARAFRSQLFNKSDQVEGSALKYLKRCFFYDRFWFLNGHFWLDFFKSLAPGNG